MKKYILIILGILFALGLTSLYNGWVLTLLWSWFITPVFGLEAITILQAIGFSLFVGFLTYRHDGHGLDKDEAEALKNIFNIFVGGFMSSTFILLFAYVLQMFM